MTEPKTKIRRPRPEDKEWILEQAEEIREFRFQLLLRDGRILQEEQVVELAE